MDRSLDPNGAVFWLDRVRYTYPGRIVALEELSLEVRRSQHVVMLGANGSGKSTLMKVLDGLYFPQEGQIHAFGKPLTERALEDESFAYEFRRRVGLIFQDPDVQLFSATVWDEIAFGPLQLGWEPQAVKQRVEAMLEWLGLTPLRDRPPYRLSGGEKRKVALAAVLAVEPEVLLLDEPSAFLDPRSRCQLLDFLLEWEEGEGTLVLCTHDLELAAELGRKIYILHRGRVLAEGVPDEILADEALLQQTNLLHAHRHRHGDEIHVHGHDHRAHLHDRYSGC